MMRQSAINERRPAGPVWRSRRTRTIQHTLLVVLGLNLAVALAKLGYGLMTNSLSMTADGLNSMMDGASNLVGLIGVWIASRPPDPNHPYGHRRFETLTALGIAVFMIVAMIQILQTAWARWQTGSLPEVTGISFLVMGLTLVVNLMVTGWERRAGRRLNSSVLIADARHTLNDAFVTISVIAGLVLVRLGYPTADLLLALVVAGVIAWGAWTVIRDAALSLSDVAAHSALDIVRAAQSVNGVEGVHNVRTRGSEGLVWVDLHIQVNPDLRVDEAHQIASEVAEQVESEIGETADVTVHVEPADERHLRPERGYQPER